MVPSREQVRSAGNRYDLPSDTPMPMVSMPVAQYEKVCAVLELAAQLLSGWSELLPERDPDKLASCGDGHGALTLEWLAEWNGEVDDGS